MSELQLENAEITVVRNRIMVSEDGTTQIYFQVRVLYQTNTKTWQTVNLIKHFTDFEHLNETMQTTAFVEDRVPKLPPRDSKGNKKPTAQMQNELQDWLV